MNRKRIQRARRQRTRQMICCIIAAAALGGIAVRCSRPRIYTHYVIHEVRSGDTLWEIARDTYGDTVDVRQMIDHISEINSIKGGKIYAGQALSLPMGGE